MSTVLIIGASRGLGLETVRQGLAQGYSVRAFSRSLDSIDIDSPSLSKIAGSALNVSDIENAVDGVDAVITTLGIGPTLGHVHLFSASSRLITQAMSKHGVKRLIAVTGIGAGNSKGVGGPLYSKLFRPLLLGRIYEDKDVEEKIIQASDLDWTIVRPGFLTRFPKTDEYKVLTDPKEWRGGFISRADVADFLITQIDDEQYLHKTPLLID